MSLRLLFSLLLFLFSGLVFSQSSNYARLSTEFLQGIINKENPQPYIDRISNLDLKLLAKELDTDNKTKAFWINIYNAYIQVILNEQPALFENRNDFFKKDQIIVGGQAVSFDLIEHGIIRGSKVKLSMGYLKDPFASDFEKNFRVNETDGRIHFALNCGAKSCPKVAVYTPENLDNELDAIARQFLQATTTYDAKTNTAHVSTLFSWFRGDFNDRGGIVGYLTEYGAIPESAAKPSLKFKDYDWTLDLGNFTTFD